MYIYVYIFFCTSTQKLHAAASKFQFKRLTP